MPLPPGPRTPAAIQTLQWLARPLTFLDRCQERYGDYFTLRFAGFGTLVFSSDPAAARALFKSDRDNGLPSTRGALLEPVMGSRSILLLEGEEHLRRRRLMLPPFHGERMRAYKEQIRAIAEAELDSWSIGEPFALHPRFQAITLEVILSAVFGVSDEVRRERLRAELREVLRMTSGPWAQALGLATRRFGRLGPYGRFQSAIDRVDAVLAEEIAERKSDPDLDRREDILSMLVAARFEDGEAMADGEIRDQLMTLLLAGHETTATALAWTLDLLFRHPKAMERLRDEIEAGEEDFLDAVIQESLRIRPVVPNVGRRLGEAIELGGHELPAGTDVTLSIYLLQLRDDVYPDAVSFRPERFLEGAPETYSWIPFGGGTRRCLGAAFATFEIKLVLRLLLTRARLRSADQRPEPIARRNITFSPKRGTPAVLEERIGAGVALDPA